jgi:Tfp pilus assembly protein FimV
VGKRKRFTLMPLITLAALSAMVTVPALSSMHLYAATPQHYSTVIVRPGDTLWGIAAAHTPSSADVQDTIDSITQVNHLSSASITPGQRLRVPN